MKSQQIPKRRLLVFSKGGERTVNILLLRKSASLQLYYLTQTMSTNNKQLQCYIADNMQTKSCFQNILSAYCRQKKFKRH